MAPGVQLQPSAIDELISAHVSPSDVSQVHEPHLQALALQVQHNLQYQHDWAALRLHTHSPLNPSTPLPRPLVSGLPPRPIYIHPDKQIELIKAGIEEKDISPRREWVLPTHLREKWTLRRFGEVFDAVGRVPPDGGAECDEGVGEADEDGGSGEQDGDKVDEREKKRILMATVDDDSTVTYYIVHDGVVKPRQN